MSNDRLEYLFKRYYHKTATGPEREELHSLLREEKHHEEIQRLIDEAIRDTEATMILPDHASDEILGAILDASASRKPDTPAFREEDIDPDDAVFFRRKRPLFRTLLTAAAACLAGWGIFFIYQSQQSKTADDHPVSSITNDLLPGSDKARLTLWDGNVIDLENIRHTSLPAYKEILIDTSAGKVIYGNLPGNTGYNTLTTPLGGQYQVELPDGSHAWLNAGSSLRFPASFSGAQRKVEMSGEVYFEIAPDKSMPFVVQLTEKDKAMEIVVLGTHFNISSYRDEPAIRTTLLEGSVEVRKGNSVKVLSPGQQAQVKQAGEDSGIVVRTVDTGDVVAWKEGRFEFNGNIKDIMRQIARWYDVEVRYEGEVGHKTFIGAIPRKNNVSEVLRVLELTGGVRFVIEDRKIIVKATGA